MKGKPASRISVTAHLLLIHFLFILFVFSGLAIADDIEFQTGITQSNFEDLSKELGSALSYKAVSPAEPMGVLGFDVGIEATFIDIDETADYWKRASENSDMPSVLPLTKIYVKKGLPLNIDVGAMFSKVFSTNISLIGAEIKYAILEGTPVTPAVAVRGSYTQLLGVDQLDLNTFALDLSVSKGILNFTPYVGIGTVWVNSDPKDLPAGIDLEKESFNDIRYFGGVRFTVLLFNLSAEIDYMEIPTYSLKAGLVF